MEQLDFSKLRRCACANVRGTARALTQLYDEALESTGLRTTQFSLLVSIASAGSVTITQLAETMLMDRTTLTRNLRPLEKQGLVESFTGQDHRTRLVKLTPPGEEAVLKAIPLWEQVQATVVEGFGQERFRALLRELREVRSLALTPVKS